MELLEFSAELEKVDKRKVAEEILWWLIEKIDTYIDNHQTEYTLSFLADTEKMPETCKVEKLGYTLTTVEIATNDVLNLEKEIENNPDVKRESEIVDCLRRFMEDVKELIVEDKEGMKRFFDALSKYYSTVAFYREKPVNKKLDGYINLQYLGFENMKLDVTKTPMIPIFNEEGEIIDYKKDKSKTEVVAKMPPAFAVDFGIEFWENKDEFSLF